MILTKKEAMAVLALRDLPAPHKNCYGVEAQTGISSVVAYRILKVLEIKKAVTKITTGAKKTLYVPTEEAIDEANTIL